MKTVESVSICITPKRIHRRSKENSGIINIAERRFVETFNSTMKKRFGMYLKELKSHACGREVIKQLDERRLPNYVLDECEHEVEMKDVDQVRITLIVDENIATCEDPMKYLIPSIKKATMEGKCLIGKNIYNNRELYALVK